MQTAALVEEGGEGLMQSSTKEIKSPSPKVTMLLWGMAERVGRETESASLTIPWGGPSLTDYPPRTICKMRGGGQALPATYSPSKTLVWEADTYRTSSSPSPTQPLRILA